MQHVRLAHSDEQAVDDGVAVGRVVMSPSEGEAQQHGQALVCDISVRWIVTAWPTLLQCGRSSPAQQFVPGLQPSECARTGVWTGRVLELERDLGVACAALSRRPRASWAVPRPCWLQASGTSRRGACSSAGGQRGNAWRQKLGVLLEGPSPGRPMPVGTWPPQWQEGNRDREGLLMRDWDSEWPWPLSVFCSWWHRLSACCSTCEGSSFPTSALPSPPNSPGHGCDIRLDLPHLWASTGGCGLRDPLPAPAVLRLCRLVGTEETELCRMRAQSRHHPILGEVGRGLPGVCCPAARSALRWRPAGRAGACRAGAHPSWAQLPSRGLGCLLPATSGRPRTPAPMAAGRDPWGVQRRLVGSLRGTVHHRELPVPARAGPGGLGAGAADDHQWWRGALRQKAHRHRCSPVRPHHPPPAGPPGHPCCWREGGQSCSQHQHQHLPSGASCLGPRPLHQHRRAQHGARAGGHSGSLFPGQGPLVWGAPAPPEEEGPQQPPGLCAALQEAAPAAALGRHRNAVTARLRRAGSPTSASRPAAYNT